jgi:hypothetical protein
MHTTKHDADVAVAQYVRDNWESEMDADEPPSDEAELVRQYFENVPEAYDIVEVTV